MIQHERFGSTGVTRHRTHCGLCSKRGKDAGRKSLMASALVVRDLDSVRQVNSQYDGLQSMLQEHGGQINRSSCGLCRERGEGAGRKAADGVRICLNHEDTDQQINTQCGG